MAMTLTSGEVAKDGFLISLILEGATDSDTAQPHFKPGFDANKRISLSTGAEVVWHGSIAEPLCEVQRLVFGAGGTTGQEYRLDISGVGTTADIVYSSSNNETNRANVETALSALLGSHVKVITFGSNPSTGLLELDCVFNGVGIARTNYAQMTQTTPTDGTNLAATITIATIQNGGGNGRWHLDLRVRDEADVIEFGESVTVTIPAGMFVDTDGVANEAAVAFALTNHSIVGADGFLSASITPAGPTIHVSTALGDDSRSIATAGDPTTPLLTVAAARTKLAADATHDQAGATIALREGEEYVISSGSWFNVGNDVDGASASSPLIFTHYWVAGTGGTEGVRPKVVHASGSGDAIIPINTYAEGRTYQHHIFDGIEFNNSDVATTIKVAIRLYGQVSHFTFIDCVFDEIVISDIQGGTTVANLDHIGFVRCIGFDGWAPNDAHNQGIFAIYFHAGFLISQCVFDNIGHTDAEHTEDDIFNRLLYISSSKYPLHMWGCFLSRSASDGVQCRGGGILSAVVMNENPMGGFLQSLGGTLSRSAILKADDLTGSQASARGGGFQAIQDATNTGPVAFEQCLFARTNSTGSGYSAQLLFTTDGDNTCKWRVFNCTAFNAGPFVLHGSQAPIGAYVQRNSITADGYVNDRCMYNVNDAGSGYDEADIDFYEYDRNAIHADTLTSAFRRAATDQDLATWRTNTGGDANSVTTTPSWTDNGRDLGEWNNVNGGTDSDAAFYTRVRGRALGEWRAVDRAVGAFDWLAEGYQPNISHAFTGALAQYGVPANDVDLGGAAPDQVVRLFIGVGSNILSLSVGEMV